MPTVFVQVVISFRSRLKKTFIERYMDALEEERRTFGERYLRDQLVIEVLDSMKSSIWYQDVWM